jgi:hypothetical protein
MRQPMIGICGAGRCDDALAALAAEVGRRSAQMGAVVVCGGLGGVMEAACQGAASVGGSTIGILPGSSAAQANPFVQVAIPTGMGEARNVILVQSADVIIAVGGEYGTLSEIALARKRGRTVIGLHTWELGTNPQGQPHLLTAHSPAHAVELAQHVLREIREL